jgi:hypothetical protein
MDFCKVTIFKQFQEFFQPHDGVKCLKALEMLEMHFKREISNLSCFQADAPFPDELEVPDGRRSMPGPISGLSKEVRCKHETVTRGGRQGRQFPPPMAYDWLTFQRFAFCGVL